MSPPVQTVLDVIERMRVIDDSLPSTDGAGVFNVMYLHVTERIGAELETGGGFQDPEFMAELDVRFASLWLDAFDAAAGGRKPPSAWAPLFEARTTPGIFAVQFALAGMNAHIEHDLPVALVATCIARKVPLERRTVHQDYESVNALLASVESDVRRSFIGEIGRFVDDEIGPLVHLVDSWNIDKARDLAWVHAETMWSTRRLERISAGYRRMLGHTVGMTSRCLLTPVGRPLVASRPGR